MKIDKYRILKHLGEGGEAGSRTATCTDLSSDSPVSGSPERLRPLYDIIKETLLEHGAITPRQREIEAMAPMLKIDSEGLRSLVADITATHKEIPALQELLNLIERELGKLPTQTAGKEAQTQKERLIGDLLPAAELAGKDRVWLEARLQAAPGEQDRLSGRTGGTRSVVRSAWSIWPATQAVRVHRMSGAAKPPLLAVAAVVAVSVVGLWFWSGGSAGETFRDSLADGGEGPLMVVLPAGRFSMGCLSNDSDCDDDEQPVHDVTLPNNFAMAVYEVTFAEYDRYVQATEARRQGDRGWGRGNRPVINVNWEEARAYAGWLSEQTGRSYRLPTEAEWEYAARAGTTTKYSWGNEATPEQANYNSNDRWEYTAPVGSFPANGFGLYDMHGNVYEWTQDCWHESYDGAPTNGQAWEGANGGDCDRRVLRGGSWLYDPGVLRAASRSSFGVSRRLTIRVSNRYANLGLRLVQDLP